MRPVILYGAAVIGVGAGQMIKEQIKDSIRVSLKSLIAAQQISAEALKQAENMSIMRSKNPEHGDFAANIAMLIAKDENKAPREIAVLIQKELLKILSCINKLV